MHHWGKRSVESGSGSLQEKRSVREALRGKGRRGEKPEGKGIGWDRPSWGREDASSSEGENHKSRGDLSKGKKKTEKEGIHAIVGWLTKRRMRSSR